MFEHPLKAVDTNQVQAALAKAIGELTGREWTARVQMIDYGDWNTVLGAKALITFELREERDPEFFRPTAVARET